MNDPGSPPDRYRPCVGIILLNNRDRIFVGERLDAPDAWQMPQGGIDPGESPVDAAVRELREETGIKSAELIGMDDTWRTYTLPRRISKQAWGGKYLGQAQIWAAFRFAGDDAEIDIATDVPEFARWKWTDPETLIREIVEFKREIYRQVITAYPNWKV
ncbi:MAG: RNA pyrophosphohydrolase [Alphaproteobacteria bacterium]|jgi:putative (di)nucleoside polyphosphate hydrolase|nr:RNA pyrophosphohydrolase [Alphaproteobacteria bacterium]